MKWPTIYLRWQKKESPWMWESPWIPTISYLQPGDRGEQKKIFEEIVVKISRLKFDEKYDVPGPRNLMNPKKDKHKKNTTYTHCQTVNVNGIKENLESSKTKMICNNMISNWFLIGNNGDPKAVWNEICQVLMKKNKINEELNIIYVYMCVCVCIICYI